MTHVYKEEPFIETNSGIAFWFQKPTQEMFLLHDIAHALSNQCRYMGHVKTFYSVAEHLVLVCRYLQTHGYNSKTQRTGLFHDGSEAYLVDIARPIKSVLSEYKTLEKTIEVALAEKYDLFYPFPEIIKSIDTRILLDERAQMMNPSNNTWAVEGLEPLGVKVYGWDPKTAYAEFMKEAFRVDARRD